ncbi:hypothetical protein BpHYR1_044435 [Brachionus plicatilis]|uniref:Uncharacterized protein n=1 Tax=Brachionus plicatilis TaxID=10195 RepID=A0A3M7PZP7_BRAPC|nr:hypothetical protein BpHYR1_044435 [Brachionus plicatilis]
MAKLWLTLVPGLNLLFSINSTVFLLVISPLFVFLAMLANNGLRGLSTSNKDSSKLNFCFLLFSWCSVLMVRLEAEFVLMETGGRTGVREDKDFLKLSSLAIFGCSSSEDNESRSSPNKLSRRVWKLSMTSRPCLVTKDFFGWLFSNWSPTEQRRTSMSELFESSSTTTGSGSLFCLTTMGEWSAPGDFSFAVSTVSYLRHICSIRSRLS